jgi:hypothetical protein
MEKKVRERRFGRHRVRTDRRMGERAEKGPWSAEVATAVVSNVYLENAAGKVR